MSYAGSSHVPLLLHYLIHTPSLPHSQRYPVRVLLEENGIEATGDLTTFKALGEAAAVANLIVMRREKDSPQSGAARKLENAQISADGKELTFRLRTEIEVQKPELLLQEFGVSELFRITVAKATLNSADGNIMGTLTASIISWMKTAARRIFFGTSKFISCFNLFQQFLRVPSNKISTMESTGQPSRSLSRASRLWPKYPRMYDSNNIS
jgi:hypothetical protein